MLTPAMDSQGSAGSSSDFVRKLYKMLEDPSYSSVVRWGDDGDSFVILENEQFTKSILPKHFKHSNFASFVRQLNKYDFHKVRQCTEEGVSAAYGPNAWEFKHPEFRANSKDSLDNIRRKVPAPRKTLQMPEDQAPIHQVDLVNQQLVAQAQQIEQLTARCNELTVNHQMVVQELLNAQKAILHHDRVMQDMMAFLQSMDAKQRRDSKLSMFPQPGNAGPPSSTPTPTSQSMPPPDDEPASPLEHASKLLNDLHADSHFGLTNLEQMQENIHRAGFTATPPIDPSSRTGAVPAPTSAGSASALGYPRFHEELDQVVYPMGTTNGIDPMYSEHVHNIPYSTPPKDSEAPDPRRKHADGRKRSTLWDPGWTRPPRILLVEDDYTCRQIGGKFLYSFRCVVDTALDGLEAVHKMQQEGLKYDVILMDIIMPKLDGVSACHIIRQFDRTPIIAMTSNIRCDDIQLYFQHVGMNDVLPKPFTKKSLLDMLEKHLTHLKLNVLGVGTVPALAAGASAAQSSATHSVGDASSPSQSPAGSNWQSPSQYNGVSPVNTALHNQYAPVVNHSPYLDQTGTGSTFQSPQTAVTTSRPGAHQAHQAHQRQASDITGGPEAESFNKRPRINPPPMTGPMSGRQQ